MTSAVSFAVIAFGAVPARAELAFFANGHSLSVKEHHLDGDSLVLTLRAGGQIVCEPSMIARFAPDEVPYPEPEEVGLKADTTPATPAAPTQYDAIIEKLAAQQGVDSRLVHAMIGVESAYKNTARSRKGAMGLMQLMPETARQYAVADPYDPESNIAAGIQHIKGLMQRLPLDLALAAYNAGEGAVQRFRGVPPFPETLNYVQRILAVYRPASR